MILVRPSLIPVARPTVPNCRGQAVMDGGSSDGRERRGVNLDVGHPFPQQFVAFLGDASVDVQLFQVVQLAEKRQSMTAYNTFHYFT